MGRLSIISSLVMCHQSSSGKMQGPGNGFRVWFREGQDDEMSTKILGSTAQFFRFQQYASNKGSFLKIFIAFFRKSS